MVICTEIIIYKQIHINTSYLRHDFKSRENLFLILTFNFERFQIISFLRLNNFQLIASRIYWHSSFSQFSLNSSMSPIRFFLFLTIIFLILCFLYSKVRIKKESRRNSSSLILSQPSDIVPNYYMMSFKFSLLSAK